MYTYMYIYMYGPLGAWRRPLWLTLGVNRAIVPVRGVSCRML